jgi:predicted TIM-barrel fold metal-dependent hydrolase
MLIDAHLHCTGRERADDVLRAFDEAGVDAGVLLAPFLSNGYTMHDAESLARANAYLASLVDGHADRLIGFAVINPRLRGAVALTRRSLGEHALRGLKMVPSGWVPADDCAQEVFAVAAEFRAPILFHSGIFIDGRSGRYCRPVEYEAVRAHPALKVTLAHLGWPWCDEANAVGVIDLINGVAPDESQFRFDISFGPPPPYRLQVLRLALDVLTPALLQFGSDCFLPCAGSDIAARIDTVQRLFDELDVAKDARERVFAGTAGAWLGIGGR